MKLAKRLFYFCNLIIVISCGGGGGSSSSEPTSSATSVPTPTLTSTPMPTSTATALPEPTMTATPDSRIQISGAVTYDLVPNLPNDSALDYSNITERPARGVTVQLVSDAEQVIAESTTDDSGGYRFLVEPNTDVKLRVIAEIKSGAEPGWNIRVTDNTRENSLYMMEGSLVNSGSANSTRDLHAPSGWTGFRYNETRSAAPFAILDSLYMALQALLGVDSSIVLPPFEVRWSENNRVNVTNNLTSGRLTASFYNFVDGNIYLLGFQDNDTDEYDRSVILHEFTHYLEHALSRSDNIGGSHTLTQKLDMRLVYSEGLANALAGVFGGVDIYQDSAGVGQAGGFHFSLEDATPGVTKGWFNEASVGRIIYDIADGASPSENDNVNLGLNGIYNVITDVNYIQHTSLLSVFTFLDNVRNREVNMLDELNQLAENEDIHGTDAFGANETNDAGIEYLPIYRQMNAGETLTNICTNKRIVEFSGLDVSRYIRLTIAESGNYVISATSNGSESDIKDPRVNVFLRGALVVLREPTTFLSAGEYVIEVFDQFNKDRLTNTGGSSCIDVSVLPES